MTHIPTQVAEGYFLVKYEKALLPTRPFLGAELNTRAAMMIFLTVSLFTVDACRRGPPESVLSDAAGKGDTLLVQAVLKAGGDPNAKDSDGVTALVRAVAGGHTDIIRILLAAGANPNASPHPDLSSAAGSGDVKAMETLVARGGTPLSTAAKSGNAEILQILLAARADPNEKDFEGTALTGAAYFGHTEIVRLLLGAGADANARAVENNTALILAAQNGYVDMIPLLLNSPC